MTQFSKIFSLSLMIIIGSLSLIAEDKKPQYGLQVVKKLKPKLKKYATDCTVDIIQDIVPTDSNRNGTRLKDQRNNPDFIRKDSKTYHDQSFLKARGEIKSFSNSSMRSNEGHGQLPQFIKKQPSLGIMGDREFDNLLDQLRPEPENMKRLLHYKERKKVTSTKRVHGQTLEGNLISIRRGEYTKVKKDGTFQKPRSIRKSTKRLGRMFDNSIKLPRQLPRSSASFNRSNKFKSPNHILPKTTNSVNHCKISSHCSHCN
ncbi:MAG: hypothetical protein COA79_08385 [Planctomycetota bacterium]|nr:MAG: hypothetical protein COA79_08385 [Planctomycetota bacterium]